jgi:hypothetical protein
VAPRDSDTAWTFQSLGSQDWERIERCIAHAHDHPRELGQPVDQQSVVALSQGLRIRYSIQVMGGDRWARHLAVSIQDPDTGKPVVPHGLVVNTLAAAFGFDEHALGPSRDNPFVAHAVEVVDSVDVIDTVKVARSR